MLMKQQKTADETKDFLKVSGLKAKFVSEQVGIDEQTFSKFVNHRLALSNAQLASLNNFVNEYRQRNKL